MRRTDSSLTSYYLNEKKADNSFEIHYTTLDLQHKWGACYLKQAEMIPVSTKALYLIRVMPA